MVTPFKRLGGKEELDARIAGFSRQRGRVDGEAPGETADAPVAVGAAPAPPKVAPGAPMEEHLAVAREELIARLGAEIKPERRKLLSRSDLAKLVSGAVQAYFVRHAIEANPLSRRDLVTDVMQALIAPDPTPSEALTGAMRPQHRAAVEAAKAQIQPLVLEHMDVAAAAEMPRAAFEAQLTGWVKELLAETKIQLNFVEQRELVESLVADMLGLGPLEPLIADETVTDIMVNGPKQVYVERRGKLELTDVHFRDDQHLMNVATKIVTRVGRRIDEARPLVDARLPGSRVNIIIPPLALDGASISIRKFSKKSITLDTMAAGGSISPAMATVLKIAARCRLNILISGGTGSGKTTLLNALSRMIDGVERTVTIEDAAELQLQQPHVVRLETRTANLEGTGEINMRDLLKNALRMRPDRIIIGECRGEEALDMLQAMNTGHDGSMSTVHANSPREALTRLENMIGMAGINLPSRAVRTQIASAIHMICQVNRMRDGHRRVTHLMEVVGMEGDVITTQELFTYQFQGEGSDGKLRGAFQSSGIRPAFLPRAEYFGLDRTLLEVI